MLFDDLTDKEKAQLERIGRVRSFARGSVLLREGDNGNSLFVIRTGVVELRKPFDNEQYKQLRDLVPGDFFGELSFLTDAPRSAEAIALRDAEVLEIRRRDFNRLIRRNPALGLKIYRGVAEELAQRLRRNNEDLRSTVLRALDEMVS